MNNYLQCRDQLKTGDVLQWRTASPIGFLIRLFSKGTVNHTSIIVNIQEYNELVDRRFLLEALGHGIVLTSISRRLKDHKGKVYWLPLKEEFDDKRINVGSWAFKQVGVKYDYIGLVQQIFGRVSADAMAYFCSEFAYMAWKNANIPMHNPSGLAPRPGDIPKLNICKEEVLIKDTTNG
jgi:hypothetical protein